MVWEKGVQGAGQLAAIDQEEPELPDDTVISL